MLKLLRPYMAMRFTLVGAAVVALAPLCLSFMPARQSGRAIAIKNVRIFDGSTVIPTGAQEFRGGSRMEAIHVSDLGIWRDGRERPDGHFVCRRPGAGPVRSPD